jgi:hypothetical protein
MPCGAHHGQEVRASAELLWLSRSDCNLKRQRRGDTSNFPLAYRVVLKRKMNRFCALSNPHFETDLFRLSLCRTRYDDRKAKNENWKTGKRRFHKYTHRTVKLTLFLIQPLPF